MKDFVIYLLLIFSFCTNQVRAEDTLVISENFTQQYLNKDISVYIDSTDEFSVEKYDRIKFNPNLNAQLKFGYTAYKIWITYVLINNSSDYKSLFLEVQNPRINKLSYYEQNEPGKFSRADAGDYLSFNSRPFNTTPFTFITHLKPGEVKRYFLSVDKLGEQVYVPLQLYSLNYYLDKNSFKLTLSGALLSINLFLWLISFLLIYHIPNKLSFLFCSFLGFNLLYYVAQTGLGFQYIWPEFLWFQNIAPFSSSILLSISLILLTIEYFGLKSNSKNAYRFLITITILLALLMIFLSSQYSFLINNNNEITEPLNSTLTYLPFFHKMMVFLIMGAFIFLIFISAYRFYIDRKLDSLIFHICLWVILSSAVFITLSFYGYIRNQSTLNVIPVLLNFIQGATLSYLLIIKTREIAYDKNKLKSEINSLREESVKLIIEGKENERHKISSELHDSIGLLLANIRLKLSGLTKENISKKQINDLTETLAEVSEDIRRIARGEGPKSLTSNEFNEAIYKLILLTSKSNSKININYSNTLNSENELCEELKQSLYFITSELIQNCIKHSKSKTIRVNLWNVKNDICLSVTDTGVGFNHSKNSVGIGTGLQNLQRKINDLRGVMEVDSSSTGSSIKITVPLNMSTFDENQN